MPQVETLFIDVFETSHDSINSSGLYAKKPKNPAASLSA